MVRMPWGEEPQEARQPLPTWHKLPRPTLCPNSTCTPSGGLLVCMAYTGKVTHEVACYLSPSLLQESLREESLLGCSCALSAFLSSPSSQMKFSLQGKISLRTRRKKHSSLSTKQAGAGWRRYRDLSWEWGSPKLLFICEDRK